MCGHCNTNLDPEKKDTIDKHIKSATHKKRKADAAKTGLKRQAGINETFDKAKKAKTEKEALCHDIVKMCLQANIPLTKLDKEPVRKFLNKYVRNAGSIPSSDQLRKEYVSECGDEMKVEIREALQNLPVVVIADETCDKSGRCVFAILFRTSTATAEQKLYLASCSFLSAANQTTCSQSIVDTLREYNIQYENVLGLVSDSAPYMISCYQVLQTLVGDHMLHFKCWAHKMNLVGEVFMKELKELNLTVSKVKMAFLHSRKMKSEYLQFLSDKYPHLPKVLFPDPVITRWNSWSHSVKYLDTYLPALIEFFQTQPRKNASVELLLENFGNHNTANLIYSQCKFVTDVCQSIVSLITTLEGRTYPFAHLLWEEVEDLKCKIKRNADGIFSKECNDLLKQFSDEKQKASAVNSLKCAAQKSLQKLCKHSGPDATNNLYQALGELFNPAICARKSETDVVKSLKKVPHFQSIPETALTEAYLSFHRHVVNSVRSGGKPDVVQLLLCEKIKYEEFATAALCAVWSPVNSVDAERYFSSYNLVVTDRRRSMKEATIQTCSMLLFNQ